MNSPTKSAFLDPLLTARLLQYGQSHLVEHANSLDEPLRDAYAAPLSELDPAALASWFAETISLDSGAPDDMAQRAVPPVSLVRLPKTPSEIVEWSSAAATGEELLRQGKVAVVLVAGGQGTRLGSSQPKGMYPIGPVSGATLFEMFAGQVMARGDRAHRPIPYYIMTSHATHDETVAFFQDKGFFELDPVDVKFFKQGRLPAVDRKTGAVLLSNLGEIALSPDGHGGLLTAMQRSGVIDDLHRRGVTQVFYHQVDNPLTRVCEPEFIGAHALRQSQVSTKVVPKSGAAERMGLLVEVDGRGRIIEYSDFPANRAAELEPDGSLRFWAGSTAIHLFDVAFLTSLINEKIELPLHRAIKKVSYFDPVSQQSVQPTEENALKYERFIFDVIPMAERSLVVEADRDQEFYPLKNASGEFSPETVREQISRVHRSWLEQHGVQVDPGVACEIAPRLALDAAGLAVWKSRLPKRISEPIQLTLSWEGRKSGLPTAGGN